MKKINTNVSLEELRENLASAVAEVTKINEQLKAARKTRRAYEKLEAALKEQRKATRKVERAIQRIIDAKEAEEAMLNTQEEIITTNAPTSIDPENDLTPEEEQGIEDLLVDAAEMFPEDEIKPIKIPKPKFNYKSNRENLRKFLSHKH